jgi:ankyrin repeat protein
VRIQQILFQIAVFLSLSFLLPACSSAKTLPAATTASTPSPTNAPQPTLAPLPTATPEPDTASSPLGYAAFLFAVQQGDVTSVKAFIDQGYEVNWKDSYGLSLLNYAANQGSVEIVQMLVAAGAEVNYQDPWGMSSLHAALKEGHDAAARFLLENGAGVNTATTGGYYVGFTPLHTAVFFGKVKLETIELLLQIGADVNAVDASGQTALQMAIANGWKEAEDLLNDYSSP